MCVIIKLTFITILLLQFMTYVDEVKGWKFDRKPEYFGEVIPDRAVYPNNKKLIKKIVMYHNYFRTKVDPPASNMLAMKWHKGAARGAQQWADRCQHLVHNPEEERTIPEYGACGQNIFTSSHKVPWAFAIKTWFQESENFTYGSPNNDLKVVGHYTQLAWATTHEVGCGVTKCPSGGPGNKPFFNYVCNYCPIGNWDGKLGRPYKKGRPCRLCPKSCRGGKLCTNACPFADRWSNCKELLQYGRGWLCSTDTEDGLERQNFCNATCKCKGLIHEWR